MYTYNHHIYNTLTFFNAADSLARFVVLLNFACTCACVSLLGTVTVKATLIEGSGLTEETLGVPTLLVVMLSILLILFVNAVVNFAVDP